MRGQTPSGEVTFPANIFRGEKMGKLPANFTYTSLGKMKVNPGAQIKNLNNDLKRGVVGLYGTSNDPAAPAPSGPVKTDYCLAVIVWWGMTPGEALEACKATEIK